MARARNIKPSFFMNEDLIELPFEARLLFIGLWTLADREGRLENRPKKIKMSLFPADEINVSEQLSNLSKYGFIQCYHSNDLNVIQIVNFAKHQVPHGLEKDSLLPDRNGFYTVFDRVKKVAKGKPRLLTHEQLIKEQSNGVDQSTGTHSFDDNNQHATDYSDLDNSYETVSIADQNALNPESLNLNPDSLNPEKNSLSQNASDCEKTDDPNDWQPKLESLNTKLKMAGASPVDQIVLNQTLVTFNPHYESVVMSDNQKLAKLVKWIMGDQQRAVVPKPPKQGKPTLVTQDQPQRTTDTSKTKERKFEDYHDDQIYSGTFKAGQIRKALEVGESPDQCVLRLTKAQLVGQSLERI